MRWSAILLVLAVCGCGVARAQDFQIGGDEQRQTEVPIEYRRSLGVFVVGYVNGRGPYRFGIGVENHTLLTDRVVKDAGLATRDKGVTFYGGTALEQKLQVVGGILQLGDRQVSLDQAEVEPEDSLSAYEPVADFGGWLGVELFRHGIVQIDLSHRRLVFLASNDAPHGTDVIELPLEQSAIGSDLDSLPAIAMSLNGRPGKFRFGFSSTSFNFIGTSTLGNDLFDQAHDVQTSISWTPTGTFKSQIADAGAQVELAGQDLGTASILRREDPLPMPPRFSPSVRVVIRMPPVDGTVGLSVLGRFDVTIDNTAGKAWLVPRDKQSLTCHWPPKTQPHAGLGFRPWLYKDEGIVASIVEDSVAERAGLHAGDRIVSLDDTTVPAYYERFDAACGPAAPLKVVYRNSSGEHTAVLTPEAH